MEIPNANEFKTRGYGYGRSGARETCNPRPTRTPGDGQDRRESPNWGRKAAVGAAGLIG
jgi:hypothetical protein